MKIRSVNLSVGVFPYLKGSLSCNFWQARVRLAAGEWSNKFSLDAAGSGGDLKVKKGGKLHEVTEECQQVLIFSMKSVHTSVTFLKRCFNFTFFFVQVGTQITLSYFSLTKIVEFTPFHLINNHTEVRNTLIKLRCCLRFLAFVPWKKKWRTFLAQCSFILF